MRGLVVALAGFVVLAAPACGGGAASDSDSGAIQLRAVGRGSIADSDLERSVSILKERLDRAGIEATVTRDDWKVFIELDTPRADEVGRVVDVATRRGLLEFYDLEGNLVPPSIDTAGFPVATGSLYELLVGRQSPARQDDVQSWYLFDANRQLAGGPAPTRQLLLASGKLLDGWRTLGAPPGTIVLECGVGEVVCPGVEVLEPRSNSYYLLRYDPPEVPELGGSDVVLEGTRQDRDPLTGEPIVTMQFTVDGAEKFRGITREEAARGARLSRTSGQRITQHFAVVIDREIKSWPSIDWEQYPDGIDGSNGIQISGISGVPEARTLAELLRSGALPVRFEVVARPAFGG